MWWEYIWRDRGTSEVKGELQCDRGTSDLIRGHLWCDEKASDMMEGSLPQSGSSEVLGAPPLMWWGNTLDVIEGGPLTWWEGRTSDVKEELWGDGAPLMWWGHLFVNLFHFIIPDSGSPLRRNIYTSDVMGGCTSDVKGGAMTWWGNWHDGGHLWCELKCYQGDCVHCPRLRFPIEKEHLHFLHVECRGGASKDFILLKGCRNLKKKVEKNCCR